MEMVSVDLDVRVRISMYTKFPAPRIWELCICVLVENCDACCHPYHNCYTSKILPLPSLIRTDAGCCYCWRRSRLRACLCVCATAA